MNSATKRIIAEVRTVTGRTNHHITTSAGVELLPDPARVAIVAERGGYYLLRLDRNNQCIADTWHESLESAQAQARFEYEIVPDDWRDDV